MSERREDLVVLTGDMSGTAAADADAGGLSRLVKAGSLADLAGNLETTAAVARDRY